VDVSLVDLNVGAGIGMLKTGLRNEIVLVFSFEFRYVC